MLDRTAAAKSKPSLNGMVFCARCGSEMADTGRRYYCPNTTVEAGGSCNVRPADSQGLLSSVVARMVNRLATEETVRRVTDTIREITDADLHRTNMESYESMIAYDSGLTLSIPRSAEENARSIKNMLFPTPEMLPEPPDTTRTYKGAEAQTNSWEPPHGASPASEAKASRDQLDKAEFINDEEGIREAVTNPRSYLGGNSNEETQELLELVVGKVLVDSSSAKIVYKEALPLDGDPEGIREDLVELGPATAD